MIVRAERAAHNVRVIRVTPSIALCLGHATLEELARASSDDAWLACQGQLRSPHHSSCSEAGAIAEVAMACGGALLLADTGEWRPGLLRSMLRVWAATDERVRPRLVLGFMARPSERVLDALAPYIPSGGVECLLAKFDSGGKHAE